ncbi:uncharacterized protein LOC122037572 isoform X1 [Zingiber officinale]|uniref:uncharacterized protein LOC122037572 isoform X1 n=1 Tax=Zingiber officinale TaxID=94328 RepID=UPI001C4BCF49|nr:uncharacterized protein LOC122037572 isoform X1 [Zingiber officinale]
MGFFGGCISVCLLDFFFLFPCSKTSLKLVASRIKLLRNKEELLLKQMRQDLAQILETGQEQTARLRVEHVIREQKTLSAYELIEIYCEIIVSRLPIIEAQKSCPIDVKEAVTSVIFASPRCADIPELKDINKHFTAKYGKDFVKAALEIRPDCGVSRVMVEKLSANAPDIQTKVKVLNEVAKEHGIKWESKTFEEEVQKPKDDLLSGPSSFSSVERVEIKSSDVKTSFVGSQKNESAASRYNMAAQPQVVKSTLDKEESASFHSSNWKMEFKDATAAAEAAAESAERASMAARAAAKLASRGNVSRQSSGGSYEQSAYVVKNGRPQSMKSSHVESNYTSHLKASKDTSRKDSHSVNPKAPDLHKDDLIQTSKLTKDQTLKSYTTSRENLMSEKAQFSSSPIVNVPSGNNFHEDNAKPYHYAGESISDPGPAFNFDNDPDNVDDDGSMNYEHGPSMFPSSLHSATVDDKSEVDSSAVHYDDDNSDNDDHWRRSESNLLDSFLPQQSYGPSSHLSNMDSWSHKENDARNSEITSQPDETDHSEKIEKDELHSYSDGNVPPKYDSPKYDSDEPSSESDDEMEYPILFGHVRSRNFIDTNNSSSKGFLAALPTHGAHLMDDTFALDASKHQQDAFHNEKNLEVKRGSNDKDCRSGLSVHHQTRSLGKSQSNDTGRGWTEESVNANLSDEGYESGILNIRRLSSGVRNKGYTRPPNVGNIIVASSRATMDSDDISLNDEEITISTSEFSTSIEVTTEERTSEILHTDAFRTKFRASRTNVNTSLGSEEQLANRSSDDPASTGRSIYSQSRSSENLNHPVLKTHLQQQERKGYKESNLRSPAKTISIEKGAKQTDTAEVRGSRGSISTSRNQKLNISPSTQKSTNSEVVNQWINSQNSHGRAYYDSNFDHKQAEEPEPQAASVTGNNNIVKLSRRLRPTPSVAKEDKVPDISEPVKESKTSLLNYASDFSSAKIKHSRDLQDEKSSKPQQSYSFVQEPPLKQSQTGQSVVRDRSERSQGESRQPSIKENEKSSTPSSVMKSTSRESSFNKSSHVHPKLPDYDFISAHFQSLRANVRKF